MCVHCSDRLSAGAGAVSEPHSRGPSQGEAGAVRVRAAAGRRRVARQADTAAQPRSVQPPRCQSTHAPANLLRIHTLDTAIVSLSLASVHYSSTPTCGTRRSL